MVVIKQPLHWFVTVFKFDIPLVLVGFMDKSYENCTMVEVMDGTLPVDWLQMLERHGINLEDVVNNGWGLGNDLDSLVDLVNMGLDITLGYED